MDFLFGFHSGVVLNHCFQHFWSRTLPSANTTSLLKLSTILLEISNPATAVESNSASNVEARLGREMAQGLSKEALEVLMEWLRFLVMDAAEGLSPQKDGAKQFYEALSSSGRLAEWSTAWNRKNPTDKPARLRLTQELLRLAFCSDGDYYYSFCDNGWVDGKKRQHCTHCNQCNPRSGRWHGDFDLYPGDGAACKKY
jgi:hypothetical protein